MPPAVSAKHEGSQHSRFRLRPLLRSHARPARKTAVVVRDAPDWFLSPSFAQQQHVSPDLCGGHGLDVAIGGKVVRVKRKVWGMPVARH